mgnify:CR=1 FL=1
MDSLLSRWCKVVEWDEGDVLELHRREARLSKLENTNAHVPDLQFLFEMQSKNRLLPFWPKHIEDSDRKLRLDDFMRKIYPIWGPIRTRHESEPEYSVIHKCDKAIAQSGVKVDRGFGGRGDAESIRRAEAGY